jgi:pyruvate-ferredoxin/flavodoxin oxidoreductase
MLSETRFAMLHRDFPERAELLMKEAEKFNQERWALYKGLAEVLNKK